MLANAAATAAAAAVCATVLLYVYMCICFMCGKYVNAEREMMSICYVTFSERGVQNRGKAFFFFGRFRVWIRKRVREVGRKGGRKQRKKKEKSSTDLYTLCIRMLKMTRSSVDSL